MIGKNKNGFSLVEIMIVVLIIGVLASFALPQYRGYQAKAQQQEAVNLLSQYYAAAQSALSELKAYPGNFVASGFTPKGEIHYRITAKDNSTAVPTGAANDDACIATNVACNAWTTTFKSWSEVTSGSWKATAPTNSASVDDDSFTTVATSTLITGRQDEWTINEQKTLTNVIVGR